MSRSIGSLNFDILDGDIQTARQTSIEWETRGLDGFGSIKDGSRAPESLLKTVYYASDATAAATHGTAAIAMQATVQTIVDQFGLTFDNVEILEVNCGQFRKAVIKDGVAGMVRCEIFWRVRSTA